MDPDKLMADIIADWNVWRNPSTTGYAANLTAMTIMENVSTLHDWLGKGGFEPTDYHLLAPIIEELTNWYAGACDDEGRSYECSDICTDAWHNGRIQKWYDEHDGYERNWTLDCE